MKAKREQLNEGANSHKDCLQVIMQIYRIVIEKTKNNNIIFQIKDKR